MPPDADLGENLRVQTKLLRQCLDVSAQPENNAGLEFGLESFLRYSVSLGGLPAGDQRDPTVVRIADAGLAHYRDWTVRLSGDQLGSLENLGTGGDPKSG